MRDTHQCPKCHHGEILFVPRLTDYQNSRIAAYVRADAWEEEGTVHVRGLLQAYICRSCGYTELYTKDPQKIPVDKIPGAQIIGSGAHSPYR